MFAVFAHLGAAWYGRLLPVAALQARRALTAALVVGALLSVGITLALAGAFRPMEIPAEYTAPYRSLSRTAGG